MQKYRSVLLTRKGPPEVLQVVENDLRDPGPGEGRIKIQATGVGRTDIAKTKRPSLKTFPFYSNCLKKES